MTPRALRGAGIFFALLLAAAPVRADWIDVKGEGAMNGEILEETSEAVKFRDGDGKVRTYPRDQINFLEKEAKKTRPAAGSISLFSGEKKDRQAPRASAGPAGKSALKPILGDDSPLKPVETAVVEAWKMFQSYIYYDTDFQSYIQNSARDLQRLAENKKFQSNNYVFAGAGALLIIAGIVALVIYGFKLMLKMFETGFFWGLVFLVNAANVYLSRTIGGPGGLFLATVPPALNVLFVVVYWPAARRAVTMQCYSLAVLLFGWHLLALSMR